MSRADFEQPGAPLVRGLRVTFEIKCLSGAHLPTELRDLDRAPERVFLTGFVPVGPRVAVVGTRHPTPGARAFAEEFAAELSHAGIVVVSGGAEGIDTAAHRGAMRGPMPTLVVAPCGWESPFPAANAALFESVVACGGGYLSAHASDVAAQRHAFFLRNGILVALCVAVVVIEAPFRSGARNAAAWARKLSRRLFIVPHSPWSPQGAGSNIDLKRGAELCLGARDVLGFLGREIRAPVVKRGAAQVPGSQAALPWTLVERTTASAGEGSPLLEACPEALWGCLDGGPVHVEDLCQRLGVSAAALHGTLTWLQLEGRVETNTAGWVRRRGSA